MSEIDELRRDLAELTAAIKSGNEDTATFDWEKAKVEFSNQIEKEVAAQVAEQRKSEPVRKGDPIKAEHATKTLAGNRYQKHIRDIQGQGYHKQHVGQDQKAIDFHLANLLMTKGHREFQDLIKPPSNELTLALKALSSTGSGTGDELVPTNWAGELWEDIYLSNVLTSNLVRLPMTSNPMIVPNSLGDVTFAGGTENTAATSSDPATSNQTFTVKELLAEVDWSYSLDEDAIVALMPAVRQTLARNAAEFMDGFCLNADSTATATGNINSDDGAPTALSYYLSAGQDGIRHQWLVNNSTQATSAGASLTDAHITTALALMGKYAVDPRQCLIACDVNTYFKAFCNATTSNAPGSFLTSIGDTGYSIIVTGQVAMYRGMPIVIPVKAPLTEADGKVSTTATNNTKGQISFLNRNQWMVGFQRDVEIEADRDIQKRQMIMVVSFRQAVGCRGTRSSATHTAGYYNITV